jgi:hypothetical protein
VGSNSPPFEYGLAPTTNFYLIECVGNDNVTSKARLEKVIALLPGFLSQVMCLGNPHTIISVLLKPPARTDHTESLHGLSPGPTTHKCANFPKTLTFCLCVF